jgi:hypothetical protein
MPKRMQRMKSVPANESTAFAAHLGRSADLGRGCRGRMAKERSRRAP